MLTLFACPKPFTDPHIAMIQRNAISSWTFLKPRPQIIIMGSEPGVSEVCKEFSLIQVADISRTEKGTPILSDLLKKAQEVAAERLLCYVNADILLLSELNTFPYTLFDNANLLVFGGRTDLDVCEPLDFTNPHTETRLRERASREGSLMDLGSDYFIFTKGLFDPIPPFALGRTTWDNWLIWRARNRGALLVSATSSILAIHQNHRAPKDWFPLLDLPESQSNIRMTSAWVRSYTPHDADHLLVDGRLVSCAWSAWRQRIKCFFKWVALGIRIGRNRLGLTRTGLRRLGIPISIEPPNP